jgi:hypothetical protein
LVALTIPPLALGQQFAARMAVAENPDFKVRVEFAAIKTAIAVQSENPETCCYPNGVTHATATDEQKVAARLLSQQRSRLANLVLQDPAGMAGRLAKGVVTNTALTGQSTDADIEFTVISMWNAFAKGAR